MFDNLEGYVLGKEVIAFLRIATLGDVVYEKDNIKTIHASIVANSVAGMVYTILDNAIKFRDKRREITRTTKKETIELCDLFSALYWLYSKKED